MNWLTVFVGIDVHGDEREHKVLKFLAFDDGITFVFYGARCSLREHIELKTEALEFFRSFRVNVEQKSRI